MHNILVEQLPEAVEIDGIEYPIDTDFRAALRVILAFEDPDLAQFERQMVMLENLYPEPPHDLKVAAEQAVKYLNGGKDPKEDGDVHRYFSFAKDAGFIFAAFRQTHGIDLETAELHWWKFLALFMDLGTETTFCSLVGLRKRVKTGKASKDEMRAYREMRDVIDFPEPDNRTLEEKERANEFFRMVKERKNGPGV